MKEYQDLNDYEILYMVSENDQCAKDLMYDKYRPLIVNMAYKYYKVGKKLGLEVEDFIQEGYYGLFQALSNFSDNKNCLFYTYALRSIASKMHNLCVMSETKKNQILNNSISLNKEINDDSDTSFIEMIEDKNSPNPWINLDNYDFYNLLKEYVYGDSLIEAAIFELRLNGFSVLDISILLGKSKNVIAKLLGKMKKDFRSKLVLL